MRLITLALAAAAAVLPLAPAAFADGFGDAPAFRSGPTGHRGGGHGRHAHRHGPVAGPGLAAAVAVYGPPPRFYPGAGGQAWESGLGPRGAVVVELHEPYIGRGLIYNVPPEPRWSRWSRSEVIVSAKN